MDSLDDVLPENDAANEDQLVDNEIDRAFEHPEVGMRIKGLYKNGWFIGTHRKSLR